jgi:hypothetical protein
MYWLLWFKSLRVSANPDPVFSSFALDSHFFNEFVTNVSTSWFSSNSNIVPKYPKRLSANRGEASSFRHSI